MNILSYGNFCASSYKDIVWNKIFYHASCAASTSDDPIVLVNSDFEVLLSTQFLNHSTVTLCGHSEKINNKNYIHTGKLRFITVLPDMLFLKLLMQQQSKTNLRLFIVLQC